MGPPEKRLPSRQAPKGTSIESRSKLIRRKLLPNLVGCSYVQTGASSAVAPSNQQACLTLSAVVVLVTLRENSEQSSAIVCGGGLMAAVL